MIGFRNKANLCIKTASKCLASANCQTQWSEAFSAHGSCPNSWNRSMWWVLGSSKNGSVWCIPSRGRSLTWPIDKGNLNYSHVLWLVFEIAQICASKRHHNFWPAQIVKRNGENAETHAKKYVGPEKLLGGDSDSARKGLQKTPVRLLITIVNLATWNFFPPLKSELHPQLDFEVVRKES